MRKSKDIDDAVYDAAGTLMTKTKDMLKADPRPLDEISLAFNIPYFWLVRLSCGSIKNPSVNRIQYLYEKLSDKKLAV